MAEAGATAAPTIRSLVADGAARLAAAGIDDPRRESARIWALLAGEAPGAMLLRSDAAADPGAARRYAAAVARRAAGEPLAYATGTVGFRTLVLRSDRRALIPRPETEGLVELVLRHAPRGRVADVGTGTGCIALSLAAEGTYDAVIGSDRSAPALALAAENVALTRCAVGLVRADLTSAFADHSLDALVSNPPYLTDDEYAVLDESVRRWEPAAALPSGSDGMRATLALLEDGRRVVRPGGLIALEVDSRRAGIAAGMAGELGWTDVSVVQDLFGRERCLLARRRAES